MMIDAVQGAKQGAKGIENRLHWVRDLSFGEDACRVRTRAAPEILAALRNAGLRLLRAIRVKNIAPAPRRQGTGGREPGHQLRP